MAATDIRVPATPSVSRRIVSGKVDAAGKRDAQIRIAELALLDVDALLVGIDAQRAAGTG